jgi:hypothetical protein
MIRTVTRRLPALAVLLLLALPALARAADNAPVFGMRGVPNPKLGYFVYPLGPGETRSGAVLVTNNGNAAGTVRVYPADATTGQTSGTVYLTDKKPVAAGSWITLDKSEFSLAPGKHQLVHFTVKVPADAKPGQWVAGLVAESQRLEQGQRTKRKASVQIKIRSQTIVAVQVNVPGPTAAKFVIGDVKAGGTRGFQQVLVRVANVGNALSKPIGSVTIVNHAGSIVESVPFRMDTFLPQTHIDYPVVLQKALPPGDYTTRVALNYQGAGGTAAKATATPPLTVSKQNVQQVFTSTTPTQAPPGSSAAPSTGGSGGGSNSTLLIAVIVIGGLILLALLALLFTRRRPPPAQT